MENNNDTQSKNKEEQKILADLQSAYASIENLKQSPSHKKIVLSIEKKMKAKKGK